MSDKCLTPTIAGSLPVTKEQAIADLALINPNNNEVWQEYNSVMEVVLPPGTPIHMGFAAPMGKAPGGGWQIWLEDEVVDFNNGVIDWLAADAAAKPLR